jgi:hypothetical protein
MATISVCARLVLGDEAVANKERGESTSLVAVGADCGCAPPAGEALAVLAVVALAAARVQLFAGVADELEWAWVAVEADSGEGGVVHVVAAVAVLKEGGAV